MTEKQRINKMIKGVIFDLDGVITDSMYLHNSVEQKIFSDYGVEISTDELKEKYAGIPFESTFSKLVKKEFNLEKVSLRKHNDLMKKAKGNIKAVDGAVELVKLLSNNGFKLAIGSGSHEEFVELALTELGIINYFDAIVSLDEVTYGKPDPETFLNAATALGLHPDECIVIEDGRSGMIAAHKAKMRSIGLVHNLNQDVPSDIKITSLKDLTLDSFKN